MESAHDLAGKIQKMRRGCDLEKREDHRNPEQQTAFARVWEAFDQGIVQAKIGAYTGILAFFLIVVSGAAGMVSVFYVGVVLLGFATGLSTVSNLSLMLDMTTVGSVGLFIGAWGMASAMARLTGNLLSGVLRESFTPLLDSSVGGYNVVFIVEILILIVSLLILRGVDVSLFQKQSEQSLSYLERAAISNEV